MPDKNEDYESVAARATQIVIYLLLKVALLALLVMLVISKKSGFLKDIVDRWFN